MKKEELEAEIQRKEKEIQDLIRFKSLVPDLEKAIDLRLEDLYKLYKQREN